MATFDTTVRSFVTQAASNAPTPGGGSVAALVAALGASMTSMVGNLSQGAKFADVEAEMTTAVGKMTAAIGQFEELLEADIASFGRYMAALQLPRDTDEQKAARSQALQEAAIQATEVPMRLARLCLDSLQSSEFIAETANKNVISDLGIAALLLESAAQSALLTVDMNLPGLKDLARKSAYEAERDALVNSITPLKDKIVTIVRQRLS